jgi:hypothetical protein
MRGKVAKEMRKALLLKYEMFKPYKTEAGARKQFRHAIKEMKRQYKNTPRNERNKVEIK